MVEQRARARVERSHDPESPTVLRFVDSGNDVLAGEARMWPLTAGDVA